MHPDVVEMQVTECDPIDVLDLDIRQRLQKFLDRLARFRLPSLLEVLLHPFVVHIFAQAEIEDDLVGAVLDEKGKVLLGRSERLVAESGRQRTISSISPSQLLLCQHVNLYSAEAARAPFDEQVAPAPHLAGLQDRDAVSDGHVALR